MIISFPSYCLCQINIDNIKWCSDGHAYYQQIENTILRASAPGMVPKVIVSEKNLIAPGRSQPLFIRDYAVSDDQEKVLIFTNPTEEWGFDHAGDYWVLDLTSGSLVQLGKKFPKSSLKFAKFSPDGKSVAYISRNNLYLEDPATSKIKALTTDGKDELLNGCFPYSYETILDCIDGFRWSPDGKYIAYWQIDASRLKKFSWINNTDSVYPQVVTIGYSVAGQDPPACKVGVVNLENASTTWMKIPGDPAQHYIVRMEFIPGSGNLLIQQLNRKQNESRLFIADIATGNANLLQEESDEAWVGIYPFGNAHQTGFKNTFDWLEETGSILWISEKDGWRHFYMIPLDGKPEKRITKGNYDIMGLRCIDYKNDYLYFLASPWNATQRYLFRTRLDGDHDPELVTPAQLDGSHDYSISADGKFAAHIFSNHKTQEAFEFITLPGHQPVSAKDAIIARLDTLQKPSNLEFFTVTTCDSVELDGWMAKPKSFDPAKKYPLVFYVYTEPYGRTVVDRYGISATYIYEKNVLEDGYISISLDNRGTPAPKGREWRKAIYRKLGQVNIRDQAMAAMEILKWEFIDTARVAVWGWSAGGTATLNLLFQYPQIYKTGIAVASIADYRNYDNIYSERYMGLPQENREDYEKGSPLTYAGNLHGNLLILHGTGDYNVHYQNAELLINELVKYNKQFTLMSYPNRTHGIYNGEGTWDHFTSLCTGFLMKNCPPGGR